MYVCDCLSCIYVMCIQCPWWPDEGIRSSRTGVADKCELHLGPGTWPWVPYKTYKCCISLALTEVDAVADIWSETIPVGSGSLPCCQCYCCWHLTWDHSCWFRILTLLSMLLLVNEEQRIENTQWSVMWKTSKCWFGNLACFSILKQVLIRSWSVSLKRVIGLAIASSSQRPSSGDLLPSLSYVAQAGS